MGSLHAKGTVTGRNGSVVGGEWRLACAQPMGLIDVVSDSLEGPNGGLVGAVDLEAERDVTSGADRVADPFPADQIARDRPASIGGVPEVYEAGPVVQPDSPDPMLEPAPAQSVSNLRRTQLAHAGNRLPEPRRAGRAGETPTAAGKSTTPFGHRETPPSTELSAPAGGTGQRSMRRDAPLR